MTEPDVALTDYGLAVECALFAWLIFTRNPRSPLRTWLVVFFLSLSAAALAGGTVHGFFLDPLSKGQQLLWPMTLLAIGVTALAAWMIGARIRFTGAIRRGIAIVAWVGFLAYCVVVLRGSRDFVVAIVNYLPASLFLLLVLWGLYRRTGARSALHGVTGLLLTFLASGIQQAGIVLHPRYFNHNALYHVIQAVALFLLYRMARGFASDRMLAAGR